MTEIIKQVDIFTCLGEIETNSIDLILTDPPYLISRQSGYINNSPDKADYIQKYGKHRIDFGEWDKQDIDLERVLSEFYRVLKPHGTLIMFYDFWKMQELHDCAESVKFKQARLGVWNKTNPVPINSKLNYLSNAKEFFVSFVKVSKPTFNSEYDNAEYYYACQECDTYFLPIVHGKERTKHPTQKPLALIKDLVAKHSNEGDMILDCFCGSGTTGVACRELGRSFIISDVNKEYIDIAKSRLG